MLREVTFPAATSLLNLVQGFGIIYNDLFIILSKEYMTWFQNDFNFTFHSLLQLIYSDMKPRQLINEYSIWQLQNENLTKLHDLKYLPCATSQDLDDRIIQNQITFWGRHQGRGR